MAFCAKCGERLDEGATVCPKCGEPVTPAESSSATDKIREGFNKITDTPDTTSACDPQDIANNKVFAILAYIGILFLIPLLAAKDSKFARFHTNQGFVLFLVELIVGAVGGVFSFIPVIKYIMGVVCGVVGVITLVLAILGIVNAANGVCKELPFIGEIKLLK